MRCPCYGCTERTITCHGVCKRYKEWSAENQAIKDDLREKNALYVSDYSLRVHWDRIKQRKRYGKAKQRR